MKMTFYNREEGVFANISNVLGSSVILVRISTPKIAELEGVFAAMGLNLANFPHANAKLARVFLNGKLLDECLITLFFAPKSFTGENVAELALHGSRFIFETLCEFLAGKGLRFAERGEFSYRAFLNGKIDLIQAEGIAALVASESEIQHKYALKQLNGEASKVFAKLRTEVLNCLGSLESLIDFSDEEIPADLEKRLNGEVAGLGRQISEYLQKTSGEVLSGVKIVIVGRPNVGKSSIFNRISGYEKAIVSEHAGTTRDVLENRLILAGIPVTFYDTAGIRSSTEAGKIEQEGIKRAVLQIEKSDIRILTRSADAPESFAELAQAFGVPLDSKTLLLTNKCDISRESDESSVQISALTGEGFPEFFSHLEGLIKREFLSELEGAAALSERQRIGLKRALEALERFNLNEGAEIAAETLRIAARDLSLIIGTTSPEDVLGNIFSKFCIGK